MMLGVAEPPDLSNANLIMVMVGLGLFAAAAVAVVTAVGIARWRGHRRVGMIAWVATFWAVLMVGTVGSGLYEQHAFAAERALMLQTRSYDPSMELRAPMWPWVPTVLLVVGYGVILVGAVMGGKKIDEGEEGRGGGA